MCAHELRERYGRLNDYIDKICSYIEKVVCDNVFYPDDKQKIIYHIGALRSYIISYNKIYDKMLPIDISNTITALHNKVDTFLDRQNEPIMTRLIPEFIKQLKMDYDELNRQSFEISKHMYGTNEIYVV